MNRETTMRFRDMPTIRAQRSKIRMPSSHKTTFNTGDLIPLYVDGDILPGDTIKMKISEVVRMTTPIYPVMDNAFMDIMCFFVPHRLVWENWTSFWGENEDAWEQSTEYEIPQIKAPSGGWNKGTIADYFGIPTGIDNISISHLQARAYCKVWNDWYRDENLKDSCYITKDETTLTGTNSGDYVTNGELMGAPLKVAKVHDMFTSCLPEPQKGPDVTIPLGTEAPVAALNKTHNYGNFSIMYDDKEERLDTTKNYKMVTKYATFGTGITEWGMFSDNGTGATNVGFTGDNLVPINLWADFTNATAATINQLRQAFAVQKFYEQLARGGSRYTEFIKSIFGVTSSDARLQRSEYLGGKRIPINMEQVIQTSSTDATTPQGNTAAYSNTVDVHEYFTKSFEEHGTLLVLGCVRTDHTYQQGIEKQFLRKKFTDYYLPVFANLGEMAILNEQIYADGTSADKEAFGYQEAYAEYRYKPNRVSSAMRSNYATSLDAWHYADYYQSLPTLSGDWIDEPKENVDRTLAVQSAIENQFIGDFYFDATYVRPMPIYSIPGLIDHM